MFARQEYEKKYLGKAVLIIRGYPEITVCKSIVTILESRRYIGKSGMVVDISIGTEALVKIRIPGKTDPIWFPADCVVLDTDHQLMIF